MMPEAPRITNPKLLDHAQVKGGRVELWKGSKGYYVYARYDILVRMTGPDKKEETGKRKFEEMTEELRK